MKQKKINEFFNILLDTKLECFDTPENFELSYIKDNNKKLEIKLDVTFEEITNNNEIITGKLIESTIIGENKIKVNLDHLFKENSLIKIDNDYFFILSIVENELLLDRTIKSLYTSDTVISTSNLTGIYTTNIKFDEEGIYYILIKNKVNHKHVLNSLCIVSETYNDKLDSLKFNEKTFI